MYVIMCVTSIKENNYGLSYQNHNFRKVSFYDLPQTLRVDCQKCWLEKGDQRRLDDAQTIMHNRAASSDNHRCSYSLSNGMILGLCQHVYL